MKTNTWFFLLLCFVFSFTGKSQTALNIYADSLDGFDREAVKLNLLSNHVFGQEYISCLQNSERAFIDQKYNLAACPALTLNSQNATGPRIIGGPNTTLNAPCVNEGFESTSPGSYTGAANATAINSWSISSFVINTGVCAPVPAPYVAGSPEAWIITTPALNVPGIGTLPNSPLGGSNVLQLNDFVATGLQTRIRQSFPVTASNNLFMYAFAGVWQEGGHACCMQAGFRVRLYDCNGTELSCVSHTFVTIGSSCTIPPGGSYTVSQVNGVYTYWTSWQTRSVDLTPFIGSCITVEVVGSDCTGAGHYGVTYFDSQCSTQPIQGSGIPGGPGPNPGPVSFCPGSNQAIMQAPLGYSSYQWISPTTGIIPPGLGGTAQSYTVSNPLPNSVYSVNLTTPNGCQFVATYTLQFTTIGIAQTVTSPACSALATNGSATVITGGSSVGYSYSWLNTSGVEVGTTAVLSNAQPGNYTVIATTPPSMPGCGTASASITIPVAPIQFSGMLKYYCGAFAYLQSPVPGTNFKWYNNGTLIPAVQGGTASSYTVTSPATGQVYQLGYFNSQGCRDSIIFTLAPSNGGSVSVLNNSGACAGTFSANATVSLTPVSSLSNNSFTVFSTGTTPAYSTTFNTAAYSYMATNLSTGGTYSVNSFDGSCFYGTSFTVGVIAPTFNYSVVSSASIVCPMATPFVSVNIANSASYTYTWSHASILFTTGNQGSPILSPTIPIGTNSIIVFTVVVTPTASGCPLTKTISLNFVNPATPTLVPVPQVCSNGSAYQVSAYPAGGSFYTSQTNSPIGLSSGILLPGLAQMGVNTFTYVASINTCTASATGSYTVNAAPSLTISGPVTACEGAIVTWPASGADTYSWNPAGPGAGSFTAPAVTTVYTVIATNTISNCSSVGIKMLMVNPLPVLSVSGPSIACAGQPVIWYANGAHIYLWNPATVGAGIFNAPAATTTYTLTGTIPATNCSAVITKTLSIDPCTGIKSQGTENEIRVYPNPALNEITVETQLPLTAVLYSELGSVVLERNLQSGKTIIDMSSYSSGIYLLKTRDANGIKVMKVVKVNH